MSIFCVDRGSVIKCRQNGCVVENNNNNNKDNVYGAVVVTV